MSGPLFDVFLRTGFAAAPTGETAPRREALLERLLGCGGGTAACYGLNERFAEEVLPAVRRGRAPFVLFADQVLDLGASPLRRLARVLRHNPGLPALTFGSPALERVYGDAPEGPGRGRVAQRLTPAPHLPSWLCVVSRAAIDRHEGPGWRTLEYFLLDLGRRLSGRQMGSVGIEIDTRFWVRDLLFQAADGLAEDYGRWRADFGDEAPPQLRVEVQGEPVPHPGRLAPEELERSQETAPKISILCPVFKPDHLEEMLGSVLQQTWRNWELLILVDGPPAEDARRIEEILARVKSEPRIRTWSWENHGTGPSRRALAEAATGDFVLPMDDDDLLPAHALEVFASAVRRHPGVACFRGGTQLVGLVHEVLRPRRRLLVGGISADPFEVSQPFLVARETLAALGGFEGDPAIRNAGEDTYLFHELDRARVRALLIDEPLYLRRLGHGNLSLGFERDEVLDHFRNLERRFCPPGWRSVDRHNELQGGFQQSIVTYRRDGKGLEVVAATRFFQYKTLGEESLAAIDLEITSVCNAVCGFCPREAMPDTKSFMPLAVVQALAAQLAQEPRPRQVVLCGIGESTLHPELLPIVQLLARAGARVCMTTNGSRLDAGLFRKLVGAGLQELNVSLNAATPETHGRVMRLRKFESIRENVREVLDLKHRLFPHIRVHVSFVLCDGNAHELEAFVGEWRATPATQVWIHPLNNRAGLLSRDLHPVDLKPVALRYRDDERVVVDIFEHHPEHGNVCRIAQNMDFISVDGSLRLCAMDYERRTDYGNVRHDLLRHLYLEKILSYRRGDTLSLCRLCDFHPGNRHEEEAVGLADVPA